MKQTNKTSYLVLGASLLIMGLGQLLLSFGKDFIDSQAPVDWAHWMLLVGAVGGAVSFFTMELGVVGKVARVLVLMGAIAFVGMAAIDILLWTIPETAAFDDAIDSALESPGVAIPFLWVGPSLFFVGIALKATEWLRQGTWAAILIIVGTLLCGFGQATRMHGAILLSFALMLVGLYGISSSKKTK